MNYDCYVIICVICLLDLYDYSVSILCAISVMVFMRIRERMGRQQ